MLFFCRLEHIWPGLKMTVSSDLKTRLICPKQNFIVFIHSTIKLDKHLREGFWNGVVQGRRHVNFAKQSVVSVNSDGLLLLDDLAPRGVSGAMDHSHGK